MKKYYGLIFMLLGFVWACNPETKTNTENEAQKTEEAVAEEEKNSAATEVMARLPQETAQRSKQGDATVISLFDAEIATGEHQPLLEKLFQGGTITPANATELVDAFDISLNKQNYCVLITYA